MKGNVSMVFSRDNRGVFTLDISDDKSNEMIVSLSLSAEVFALLITGRALSDVQAELGDNLSRVGMQRVSKPVTAVMPECSYSERDVVAYASCLEAADEGWEVSKYFGSQSSFFTGSDGVRYCKTTQYKFEE